MFAHICYKTTCWGSQQNFRWREENGVDTILTDWTPPELLPKYYPGGLFGHDKLGHPIYFETVGYADIRGTFFMGSLQKC